MLTDAAVLGDWLHCETVDCLTVSSGFRLGADGRSWDIAPIEPRAVTDRYCVESASSSSQWTRWDRVIDVRGVSFVVLDNGQALMVGLFLPKVARFVHMPPGLAVDGCLRQPAPCTEPGLCRGGVCKDGVCCPSTSGRSFGWCGTQDDEEVNGIAPWRHETFELLEEAYRPRRNVLDFPFGDWLPCRSPDCAETERAGLRFVFLKPVAVRVLAAFRPSFSHNAYCPIVESTTLRWRWRRRYHELVLDNSQEVFRRVSPDRAVLVNGAERVLYKRMEHPSPHACKETPF